MWHMCSNTMIYSFHSLSCFTEEPIVPSVKPMFIDESAEWEDESTLNTPAKQAINSYFPEYDQTPHKPQSISHIIQPQTQSADSKPQPTRSSVTSHSQSATSKSESGQSAGSKPHSSSQSQSIPDRPHVPEPPEEEEEDEVPQSQLLQKLFPSVSLTTCT